MTARQPAQSIAMAGLVVCTACLVGVSFGVAGAHAGLLLGVVLVAAIAAYLLAWPEAGVVLGIFLLYSAAPGVAVNDQGLPAVVTLAVPLMLVVPLAKRLVAGEGLVVSAGVRWLLVLVVVNIVVALAAEHQQEAQAKLVTFLVEGVVVYLLVVNVVRTPESLRRAFWAVIGAGAFLATLAVFQQLTGRFEQPLGGFAKADGAYFRELSEVFRAQGPVADANYFAQLLLPAAALSLVMIWRGGARERVVAAGAAAVCVTAIAFTYSRGAALALLAILLGLVFFRSLRAIHAAGLVALCALLLAIVPGYGERLATLSTVAGSASAQTASSSDDISAAGRATENKAAFLVFREHPLLGVGQGGFPLLYQEYARRVGGVIHTRSSSAARKKDPAAGRPPEREAHNFFLSIAADMGIAGLVVYFLLIVVTMHQLLRARRRWRGVRPDLEGMATGILLAVVGYLTAGIFLSLAFERYFWLLLGLAGAAAHILLQRSADAERTPARSLDGVRRAY